MVLLDVVYNHFGPKGNYLPRYAPQFFTERHKTPWGAAIDFGRPEVRRYLRAQRPLLAGGVPLRRPALRRGARHHRRVAAPHPRRNPRQSDVPPGKHLVLENDANQARFIGPGLQPRSGTTTRTTATTCSPRGESRRLLRRLRRLAGQASRALPRRGLRLPGRGFALQPGAARRAERPPAAVRASSTSCRTTTRSATARLASG